MYDVIKRNGKKVGFDKDKIDNAIKKAFVAVNREFDQSIIDLLVLRTCADFEKKIKDKKINVEDIQDSVEKTLSESNYADVAKAYILYRKQREKVRNIDSALSDYNSIVNSYVDLNSSEYYSLGGLVMATSGAITSNYWLSEIYDEQIINAHKNGEIVIDNLDMLTGYSVVLPLEKIINEGIIAANNNIASGPSKHLNTLCNQLVNLLSIIQNEWAGPLYLLSFDSLLAKFIPLEKLTYKDVKGAIETFIYGINMPTCLGGKTPKVNIFLDYGKTKEEKMINKAILEILLNGDGNHNYFNNPKFFYKLDKDFRFKYDEVDLLLLEYVSKYKEVYFINNHNITSKGSFGIVKINPNKDDVEDTYRVLDIACRCLSMKKDIINKLFKNGLYPYTSNYVDDLNDLYLEVGLSQDNTDDLEYIKLIKEELNNIGAKYNTKYALRLVNDNNYNGEDIFNDLDNNETKYSLFNTNALYNVYLNDDKPSYKSLGSLIEKIISKYKYTCFVLRRNKG